MLRSQGAEACVAALGLREAGLRLWWRRVSPCISWLAVELVSCPQVKHRCLGEARSYCRNCLQVKSGSPQCCCSLGKRHIWPLHLPMLISASFATRYSSLRCAGTVHTPSHSCQACGTCSMNIYNKCLNVKSHINGGIHVSCGFKIVCAISFLFMESSKIYIIRTCSVNINNKK